jgi:hypothetical protein
MWLFVLTLAIGLAWYVIARAPRPQRGRRSETGYMALTQRFVGERAKIVQTMLDIASLLQGEVDMRARRARLDASDGKVVNPLRYTRLLTEQSDALAGAFEEAELAFARASSPRGTPETLRSAYGTLLDHVLNATAVLSRNEAPPSFLGTQTAYREFLSSFYEQVAKWPAEIRASADLVSENSYEMTLSATFDTSSIERALAMESLVADSR